MKFSTKDLYTKSAVSCGFGNFTEETWQLYLATFLAAVGKLLGDIKMTFIKTGFIIKSSLAVY